MSDSFLGEDNYYRDNFNTPLSPEESAKFADWVLSASKIAGHDISPDKNDYDIQGAAKEMGFALPQKGVHGTDLFKKPNHPTFSDESIYNGVSDLLKGTIAQGGHWDTTGFTLSPEQIRARSIMELMWLAEKYFPKVEGARGNPPFLDTTPALILKTP